jgi:hypothetical protein
MPFALIVDEKTRLTKPVFICDHCCKEIKDAFDGNYEWDDPQQGNLIVNVVFLHKGCVRPYDKTHHQPRFNMGIHNLMVYLLNNLDLGPKRLKEAYKNTQKLTELTS